MSDTPPDQKEAGDAPAGPRHPWLSQLFWFILTPVLYVLSLGPVAWLCEKNYLPDAVGYIYAPVWLLPEPIASVILSYMEWWIGPVRFF